jgi:ABC-type branched-subunit amino acid transport system ATPase component
MLVKDLTQPELVRFGIALGMAKDPALLVLDDIEHEFTLEEIKELCALLQDIAHNRHKVVVASCTEPSLTKFADVSFTLKGGN